MKIDETGKPMMSDADIQEMMRLFDFASSEYNVLEWGSGNSTIFFSQYKSVKHWTSIEHNGHYIDYLVPRVDHDKVTLIWVQDEADYIDCVKKNVQVYDVILIDGKEGSREYCLEAAMKMIKPDGVIILHDAYRKEYKEWIDKYPKKKVWTKGEIPDGPDHFIHRGLMAFYP